jgi:hypothetical protein
LIGQARLAPRLAAGYEHRLRHARPGLLVSEAHHLIMMALACRCAKRCTAGVRTGLD